MFGALMLVGAGAAIAVIAFVSPGGLFPHPVATAAPQDNTPVPIVTPTPVAVDLKALSIDDPTSYWVVVDKLRPLQPMSYVPKDLVTVQVARSGGQQMRSVPAMMLKSMFDAYASETGRGMKALSGYRSYATQKAVWDGNYTLTALPGHSEHQTGLAMDIGATSNKCAIQDCFANEPEGKWLAANAYKYGFILRYPQGKENITGYQFEPWHYRFVGTVLSSKMHELGVQTLEEMFSLPAAPHYADGR